MSRKLLRPTQNDPGVNSAIDSVWKIESDRTSTEWNVTAARKMAEMNRVGRAQDPAALAYVGDGFLGMIESKASKITSGVGEVLEAHRATLSPGECDVLKDRLNQTISADINFAKASVERIRGRQAQGLPQVHQRIDEHGKQKCLELLHKFELMLVGMNKSNSENNRPPPGVSVVGSSNVQIGSHHAQIKNTETQTPGAKPDGRWTWTKTGVVAFIAALAVAFCVYKFGWNH